MPGTGKSAARVVPMAAPFGAEVRGVDLRAGITDGQLTAIKDAWEKYLVLLIRGQEIDASHLVAFSRQFGDLDLPNQAYDNSVFNTELPEVVIISNIVEDGNPVGRLGDGEAVWHADMTYNDMPPKAAILYSKEIPPTGGDTFFADMYAAYDALPEDLRRRIEGRRAIHDAVHNSAGQRRKGYAEIADARQTPGRPPADGAHQSARRAQGPVPGPARQQLHPRPRRH